MCRKIIVDMALDEGRRVDGRNKNQVTTFFDYFLFTSANLGGLEEYWTTNKFYINTTTKKCFNYDF